MAKNILRFVHINKIIIGFNKVTLVQSYEKQGQIKTFEIIRNDRNHLVESMLVRELPFFSPSFGSIVTR